MTPEENITIEIDEDYHYETWYDSKGKIIKQIKLDALIQEN